MNSVEYMENLILVLNAKGVNRGVVLEKIKTAVECFEMQLEREEALTKLLLKRELGLPPVYRLGETLKNHFITELREAIAKGKEATR